MTQRISMMALAGLAVVGMGCSTPIRSVTNGYWVDGAGGSRLYLSYWEGQCKPILGCGTGEGHVKFCSQNSDNSMSCKDQPAIDSLLAD